MADLDLTKTKICSKCEVEKLAYIDFELTKDKDGVKRFPRKECRICRREINKQYNRDNKEARKKYADEYRKNNKHKIKEHYEANKEVILQKCKEYREKNKEKIKAFKRAYYQDPENKRKKNEKQKYRHHTDIVFRINKNIRTRIHNMLKQNKTNHTDELIGCTRLQLIEWLGSQLTPGLTWENYGKEWHVDHVIPIAFFNIKKVSQQFLAFNWTNLQPLKGSENLSKNDYIVKDMIVNQINKIEAFMADNKGYQTSLETCWWMRLKLMYGNNPQDEEGFEDLLKSTIRIEDTDESEIESSGDEASELIGSLNIV